MSNIRVAENSECEQVLALWQAGCIEAVGHPLSDESAKQVLKNLRQYVIHETCHCFVAVDREQVIGFVTCSLLSHPIEGGYVGHVEELFVQPTYDRNAIASELVHQAVVRLKQQGAGVMITRVAVDDPDQLKFWEMQKWEQDTVNFAIYSNVPADPESQAVWDSYTT